MQWESGWGFFWGKSERGKKKELQKLFPKIKIKKPKNGMRGKGARGRKISQGRKLKSSRAFDLSLDAGKRFST